MPNSNSVARQALVRPLSSKFKILNKSCAAALFLSLHTLAHAASHQSQLPAEARALLNTYGGKITLDLVAAGALRSFDSYKAIQAAKPAVSAPELQANAPLDTQLTAQAGRLVDTNEPQIPFSPSRTLSTQASVGLATQFSTGTRASFEISHGNTEIGFAPGSFASPTSFFETVGKFKLSQSLWKDSFGKSTRLLREAGSQTSLAAEAALTEATEEWMTGLFRVFYDAWLAQAQAQAADESLDRRERLLTITQLKAKRGTAARPELLQVESATLSSRAQDDQAAQLLSDRWRALVIALKLPDEWLKIDPKMIPIELDTPGKSALSACAQREKQAASELPQTSTMKKFALQADAAQKRYDQTSNLNSPDLSLNFGLETNGIDTRDRSTTLTEVSSLDHPAWTLALQLTVPLQRSVEKAVHLSALSEQLRTEALAAQARDQQRLDWLNACTDLERLERSHLLLTQAFGNQLLRSQLEEQRFRVGETPTLAVITAGDDTTSTQLSLQANDIQRRLAAWRVQRLEDGYQAYLTQLGQNKAQP